MNMMSPTKRGQGQYTLDLRVAPKGYEGSYRSVGNILTLIVVHVFVATQHIEKEV